MGLLDKWGNRPSSGLVGDRSDTIHPGPYGDGDPYADDGFFADDLDEDVGRPEAVPEAPEAVEPPEDIVPFNWWVVEPEGEKLEAGKLTLLRDQNEGARARRGKILSAPTPELNRYKVWTGATVVFLRYAGVDFRLGGKNVVALREADIIGVVTPVVQSGFGGIVYEQEYSAAEVERLNRQFGDLVPRERQAALDAINREDV